MNQYSAIGSHHIGVTGSSMSNTQCDVTTCQMTSVVDCPSDILTL